MINFREKLVQEIFVLFLLLCGFVKCADGGHPFGEGKYVLKCTGRSPLLSSFGSHEFMASMIDPLRRAQYDSHCEENPGKQGRKVQEVRDLAVAELGEAYLPEMQIPGEKLLKRPSPCLLKTFVTNSRFDKKRILEWWVLSA